MLNHILEYQLSTSENVDVVQVTSIQKKKIPKPIAHLQDMPNQILKYNLVMT